MNKGATCHVIGTIGNPSMNRVALNWFHTISTYGGKTIEYRIKISLNFFQSKLKIIMQFGCVLGIIGRAFS